MTKSTLILITMLALLAGALGFNYFFQPLANLDLSRLGSPEAASTEQPASPAAELSGDPADQIPAALEQMTAEQKIAQLMAVPWVLDSQDTEANPATAAASTSSADGSATRAALLTEFQPGMVTLFGEGVARQTVDTHLAELSAQLNAAAETLPAGNVRPPGGEVGPPGARPRPLIAVDHEGGEVQRLSGDGFTQLPSWQALCRQPLGEMARTIAASARELQAAGIDVVLAPMVDVAERHPVLRERVCSDDPQEVTERAFQTSTIYQQHGILPVIKHFPGIGDSTANLHRSFDSIVVSPEAARPFRGVLEQLADIGVMTTHVGVENQQPEVPCSLSIDCVNQIKRNFPQTIIFADALDMAAAAHRPPSDEASQEQSPKTLTEVSEEAIVAGNDILIYGLEVPLAELEAIKAQLAERYRTSPSFKVAVDDRLERVLDLKFNRR